MRHLNRLNGFGEGSNLIELDENRIAVFPFNGFLKTLSVGDEKVIPDQLHPIPHPFSHQTKTFPIVFMV